MPTQPNGSDCFSPISDGFITPYREKGEYGVWLREDQNRQCRIFEARMEVERAVALLGAEGEVATVEAETSTA